MFRKIRNAALALAAVAALGTATLVTSTTSADAMRGGFSGGFRGGSMGHVGMRHVGGPRMIGARIHSPRIRVIGRPILRPNWCRWHRCGIHVRWPRPIIYGAAPVVATTYAVTPAVTATAKACTCLTKEYTQDGLVVFKDLCTKEVASAPIGNTQTQLQLPAQEQAPTQQQ